MIVKGRSRDSTPHYLPEQYAFATVTFATVGRPFLEEEANHPEAEAKVEAMRILSHAAEGNAVDGLLKS